MPDWLQALFDLMANERIKLVITGEFNEVYVELFIERWGDFRHIGEWDAPDLNEAMTELMARVEESRK